MAKNKTPKQNGGAGKTAGTTKSVSSEKVKGESSIKRHLPLLPIPVIVFLLVWIWAAWWQGDVFRMVRENSFFAFDKTLMTYEISKPYGILWCIGRALLTTFRYPWLGGLLLSLMLTASCWLFGYALRLKPVLRWIQYLPLGIFTSIFTYQGLSNYFEAESGHVMGIPFCILVILLVWAIIIRSFSRKPSPSIIKTPKDETPTQNHLQLIIAILMLVIPMAYAHYERPYVRPIAKMQVAVINQDWKKVIDVAHDNAEQSYRPLAANYAIALVQTGQIAESLFDIRLDYDSLYICGLNGDRSNAANMYVMECDYHAGLVETAYHHAMESMAMEGPTVRNLKMLCKTSLIRNEWEVAEKYLTIINKIPFEGDFIAKYQPMLRDTALINADPEIQMVRLLEPVHDTFENRYIQPVFLGYNAGLYEGRSINALWNSLMVHIYTKTMQDFLARCQPLQGSTPPTSVAQALTLMANKNPNLLQMFNGLNMYQGSLVSFIEDTRQYMTEEVVDTGVITSAQNRALHARALFSKYKGYYPYYYFFGNLKATKKRTTTESSSAGVN